MSKTRCFCGPAYAPKFLRLFLSLPFNAACRLHDIHYAKRMYPRLECDQIFSRNMIRLCKRKNLTNSKYILAHVYYYLVRLFGWLSY